MSNIKNSQDVYKPATFLQQCVCRLLRLYRDLASIREEHWHFVPYLE